MPEKLNLTQICAALAPIKLDAAGLARLGIPHEKDRTAVLMPAAKLPQLADALIDHLYATLDEFLGQGKRAAPAPVVVRLSADDTEGDAI